MGASAEGAFAAREGEEAFEEDEVADPDDGGEVDGGPAGDVGEAVGGGGDGEAVGGGVDAAAAREVDVGEEEGFAGEDPGEAEEEGEGEAAASLRARQQRGASAAAELMMGWYTPGPLSSCAPDTGRMPVPRPDFSRAGCPCYEASGRTSVVWRRSASSSASVTSKAGWASGAEASSERWRRAWA